MINLEELQLLSLEEILDEIHTISIFQDGVMMLVRQETNNDVRYKLLGEYDKAQQYYELLNNEIMERTRRTR